MNVAILSCISPSSSVSSAPSIRRASGRPSPRCTRRCLRRRRRRGGRGRFEARSATLDAEGFLHALRGC